MTRKRFVKQLMSIGYSRNEANKEARTAVSDGVSYGSRYFFILLQKSGLVPAEGYDSIGDCVARVSRIIDDTVNRFIEVIPTVIEAITAAIPQIVAEIERLRQEAETATE